MTDGVVSEWYGPSDLQAAEMRAGIRRSGMGLPQLLHRHAYGEPCSRRCELVTP